VSPSRFDQAGSFTGDGVAALISSQRLLDESGPSRPWSSATRWRFASPVNTILAANGPRVQNGGTRPPLFITMRWTATKRRQNLAGAAVFLWGKVIQRPGVARWASDWPEPLKRHWFFSKRCLGHSRTGGPPSCAVGQLAGGRFPFADYSANRRRPSAWRISGPPLLYDPFISTAGHWARPRLLIAYALLKEQRLGDGPNSLAQCCSPGRSRVGDPQPCILPPPKAPAKGCAIVQAGVARDSKSR